METCLRMRGVEEGGEERQAALGLQAGGQGGGLLRVPGGQVGVSLWAVWGTWTRTRRHLTMEATSLAVSMARAGTRENCEMETRQASMSGLGR